MTTNAFIRFESGTVGIPRDEWESFASEHGLSRRGDGWAAGQVRAELVSDGRGHGADFSTFHMGEDCPLLAGLAVAAWARWGGTLDMAPELRALVRVPGADSPEPGLPSP